jgi:hypothetical protein
MKPPKVTKTRDQLDKSKPFFEIVDVDGLKVTYGVNMPNDTIGDQAFEWDLDGSRRARWEAYIKKLEEEGKLGDLEYREYTFHHNPTYDESNVVRAYPLSSYRMLILDVHNGEEDKG